MCIYGNGKYLDGYSNWYIIYSNGAVYAAVMSW